MIGLVGTVLSAATTNAGVAELTQAEKTKVCNKVRAIVPTNSGYGITLHKCLKFQFDVALETEALKVVELMGQTVEDMTTVCTVSLVKDPRFEVAPAAPKCELQ